MCGSLIGFKILLENSLLLHFALVGYKTFCISGGVNAAAAGTLTFMVGAETEAVFSQAERLLGHMGAKVTHCGAVGTGGAVKICNNMLLAVTMIGTSEAMNLGIK